MDYRKEHGSSWVTMVLAVLVVFMVQVALTAILGKKHVMPPRAVPQQKVKHVYHGIASGAESSSRDIWEDPTLFFRPDLRPESIMDRAVVGVESLKPAPPELVRNQVLEYSERAAEEFNARRDPAHLMYPALTSPTVTNPSVLTFTNVVKSGPVENPLPFDLSGEISGRDLEFIPSEFDHPPGTQETLVQLSLIVGPNGFVESISTLDSSGDSLHETWLKGLVNRLRFEKISQEGSDSLTSIRQTGVLTYYRPGTTSNAIENSDRGNINSDRGIQPVESP